MKARSLGQLVCWRHLFALGGMLAALVIIFYIATIVRFGHHASGLMPTNLM